MRRRFDRRAIDISEMNQVTLSVSNDVFVRQHRIRCSLNSYGSGSATTSRGVPMRRAGQRIAPFPVGSDIRANSTYFPAVIWIWICGLAIRLSATLIFPIKLVDPSAENAIFICGLMILLSILTARMRYDVLTEVFRAVAMVTCAAPFTLSVCGMAFYLGRDMPFADDWLSAADKILGLDWLSYYRLLDRSPLLWTTMDAAYKSIVYQVPALIAILCITNQIGRLYVFFAAQILCLMSVIAIAILTPANGPYLYYGAAEAGFVHAVAESPIEVFKAIDWLRHGPYTSPADLPPLITFPSFHACCGILYLWALWRTQYIRWVSLLLNFLLIAATPIVGSHYFVDVIAGIFLAIACLRAVELLAAVATRRRLNGLVRGLISPNERSAAGLRPAIPDETTSCIKDDRASAHAIPTA